MLRIAGRVVVNSSGFLNAKISQARKGARCTIYIVCRDVQRIVANATAFLKGTIVCSKEEADVPAYVVLRTTGRSCCIYGRLPQGHSKAKKNGSQTRYLPTPGSAS